MQIHPFKEPAKARSSPSEERELIARIAQHDRAAMKSLYFIYHKRLSRFLLRIVRHHELVEEIINDTMFTVWRKASEFRGDSQVSTWILGIAYRQGLKGLKRRQIGMRNNLSVAELDSHAMIGDAGAEQRELRQWLDYALASLAPAQRIVIELAYYMGHSCEEIAAITGCPVNTVKTRMFHARERLRSALSAVDKESATTPFTTQQS